MANTCTDCGAPMVCLRERLEIEMADLRDVVDLAVKQIHERYASYEISAALDWRAEASKLPWAELQRRREPFTGVTSNG